jgi:ribosome-associated protein
MKKTDSQKTDLKNQALKKKALQQQVTEAIHACQEKKAEQISVLELEQGTGAFTDYFVVCSGTNPRQIQAISDEVELRLKRAGVYPNSIEGYKQAEWVLIDYVDFVIHIFSETSRRYYDLERLWKSAKKVEPAELLAKPRKKAVAKKTVRKRA